MVRRFLIERSWGGLRRWVEGHPTLAIIGLVLALVVPGYWRQEQAIIRSADAITRAEESVQRSAVAIDRAEEAIVLIQLQREEARFVACLGDQVFALAHNGLVQYLADASTRPQEVIDAYLKANIVPVRECTPEAIAEFYEEGPEPASVPITTTTQARARGVTRPGKTTTTTGRPTTTTFYSSPHTTGTTCEALPGVSIPRGTPCP